MKLLSMTEFVLQENFKTHSRFFPETAIKYAEFLKQPLTLGMFVPVDETGNILCKPTHYDEWISEYNKGIVHGYEQVIMGEYLEAKEKVLLEGFEFVESWNGNYHFKHGDELIIIAKRGETIESRLLRLDFEIELTESAIKQIGL